MNEEVYIIYKTDPWHSYASRDLIGASDTQEGAIQLVIECSKKEGEEISKDDLYNLKNINQTQGYEGEGEFDIDGIALNILI